MSNLPQMLRQIAEEFERPECSEAGICKDAADELDRCYERLNVLEDIMGGALAYLKGDHDYANAKPGLIEELEAYSKERQEQRR